MASISSTTADVVRAPRPKGPARRKPPRGRVGLLYAAPTAAIVGVFFVVPLILTLVMSVYDWPLLGDAKPNGLTNYREIPDNEQFVGAIKFTLLYTALTTVAIFSVSFLLALLVQRPRRGVGFFRTAYFLPVVTGLGAASLLWYVLFSDTTGAFGAILSAVGVIHKPVGWLTTPTRALMSTIGMVTWKFAGFQMLVMLVGLQAIPAEIYEAARVDGATAWRMLRYITLPLLRPTLALLFILSVTGSVLAFDQFYIMTAGGPDNRTITLVYAIYRVAFSSYRLGSAAAFAVVLMLALVLLNLAQVLTLRKRDES